jgi:uncharacterized phage-associated protein
MAGGIDFNRGKFKELVLYFALTAEQEQDEGFGMVKLNKLLFRADFEAYRLLGHPITGATYEKQQYGPVARDLPIVLDELAGAGRLYWQQIPRGPETRKVPTISGEPEVHPDITQFPSDERQIIEKAWRDLATFGGKAVSNWSHENSAGWRDAPEYGQAIAYSSAFISTDSIPPEDLKRGWEHLRERGLVKDGT